MRPVIGFRRVPAMPIRRLLLGWQRSSGGDIATIARGFDVDQGLIAKLLGPHPASSLTAAEARWLCVALRAHPDEVGDRRNAARIGNVDWETETFWVDAGLDPIAVAGPA